MIVVSATCLERIIEVEDLMGGIANEFRSDKTCLIAPKKWGALFEKKNENSGDVPPSAMLDARLFIAGFWILEAQKSC